MKEDFVKMREKAGVNILAKGFDAQNERVYVVQEMASMEVIQNAMAKNQERIKEAGVDMATMQMIPLQDWFTYISGTMLVSASWHAEETEASPIPAILIILKWKMTSMTQAEKQAFLADVHVGVLALNDGDRGPLMVPIWYEY